MQPNGHLSLGLLPAQADITRSSHLLTQTLNTSNTGLSSGAGYNSVTITERGCVEDQPRSVTNSYKRTTLQPRLDIRLNRF